MTPAGPPRIAPSVLHEALLEHRRFLAGFERMAVIADPATAAALYALRSFMPRPELVLVDSSPAPALVDGGVPDGLLVHLVAPRGDEAAPAAALAELRRRTDDGARNLREFLLISTDPATGALRWAAEREGFRAMGIDPGLDPAGTASSVVGALALLVGGAASTALAEGTAA